MQGDSRELSGVYAEAGVSSDAVIFAQKQMCFESPSCLWMPRWSFPASCILDPMLATLPNTEVGEEAQRIPHKTNIHRSCVPICSLNSALHQHILFQRRRRMWQQCFPEKLKSQHQVLYCPASAHATARAALLKQNEQTLIRG